MNRSSTNSFQVLLVVCGIASATGLASAQEHPPQREWAYQEYADVVTGEGYPAALLMTPKVVDPPAKGTGIGHGYLSVGNYSKRPMEVTLSWDEPPSRASTANCKPGGCELTVRFGSAAPIKFIAVRDKHSPTLILQDGRAFVAAASRYVGAIEVQVQTLAGLVTLPFTTTSRLQAEKLSASKR